MKSVDTPFGMAAMIWMFHLLAAGMAIISLVGAEGIDWLSLFASVIVWQLFQIGAVTWILRQDGHTIKSLGGVTVASSGATVAIVATAFVPRV